MAVENSADLVVFVKEASDVKQIKLVSIMIYLLLKSTHYECMHID